MSDARVPETWPAYRLNGARHGTLEPGMPRRTRAVKWSFRSAVGLRGAPACVEGVLYFGVPRWHYRELAENFVRWIAAPNPHERFQRKLRTYRSVGRIVESRRLSLERSVYTRADNRRPHLTQSSDSQ